MMETMNQIFFLHFCTFSCKHHGSYAEVCSNVFTKKGHSQRLKQAEAEFFFSENIFQSMFMACQTHIFFLIQSQPSPGTVGKKSGVAT